MDNSKALSYWQDSKGYLNFSIEEGKDDSSRLHDFFEAGFTFRDRKWGSPDYQRYEEKIFKTTVWELAETFFAHFTSKEFASRLNKYSIDPDGPMESTIQRRIGVLDDYFRYGFVATSKKAKKEHHRYWQLYVEGYLSAEVEKIIPTRYFSKTTHNMISRPEGTSPLLIGKRREELISHLRGETSTKASKKDIDKIAIRLMGHSDEYITDLYLLQANFYRRWNHPVVIFDNNPSPKNDAYHFSTINNIDGLLERLSNIYPRLSGHPYRINGKPKDFDAEFLCYG